MSAYLTDDGKRLTPDTSEVVGIDKRWAVVTKAGTDDEYVFGDCTTFGEALRLQKLCGSGSGADIMKRRADGSLTTEF